LTIGEELLASLETDEWGRPQALGTVIVGKFIIFVMLKDVG
jgi:hypothetical protein